MGTTAIPEVKGEALKIEIRRVIRASRQRIYQAWTRPEEIRRWFAPGAMNVAAAETDLRTGGAYRIEMKGSMENKPEEAERRVGVVGAYTQLVPDELISFTWKPDFNPGEESLVTIRLRDVDGGTELLLTHERIAAEDSCTGYNRGWNSCVDKLAAYLEQ